VIRGVVPKDTTEALLNDVRQYFSGHPMKGFPSEGVQKVQSARDHLSRPRTNGNQVVYESYWSPSQVKARSHPNMLKTQSWMNQLYRADADQKSEYQLHEAPPPKLIRNLQLICLFLFLIATACKSGLQETSNLHSLRMWTAEAWKDGRTKHIITFTAKSSREM
jgi:hypothetical protein